MAASSSKKASVPEAKEAMSRFKEEAFRTMNREEAYSTLII